MRSKRTFIVLHNRSFYLRPCNRNNEVPSNRRSLKHFAMSFGLNKVRKQNWKPMYKKYSPCFKINPVATPKHHFLHELAEVTKHRS